MVVIVGIVRHGHSRRRVGRCSIFGSGVDLVVDVLIGGDILFLFPSTEETHCLLCLLVRVVIIINSHSSINSMMIVLFIINTACMFNKFKCKQSSQKVTIKFSFLKDISISVDINVLADTPLTRITTRTRIIGIKPFISFGHCSYCFDSNKTHSLLQIDDFFCWSQKKRE